MRHRRVYVARAAVRLALISATVIAGLLATAAPAAAQSDIRQDFPFEGTPGEVPVGPDVTRCGRSPDFGPFFGSTAEAFSGDTFVGFHESLGPGSPAETFSLPIDGSTTAGEDYRYGSVEFGPLALCDQVVAHSQQDHVEQPPCGSDPS